MPKTMHLEFMVYGFRLGCYQHMERQHLKPIDWLRLSKGMWRTKLRRARGKWMNFPELAMVLFPTSRSEVWPHVDLLRQP